MTRFRVSTIVLDEAEDVTEITAVVDDVAHRHILDILDAPAVKTVGVARGGTEMTIALRVADVIRLHTVCARIRGNDPRHEYTTDIYNSLCNIYYGLINSE